MTIFKTYVLINRMKIHDTKTRILDAAEELFAENGYQGTTLRRITAAAGANLAAVNYHFGSKEALLEAVFERRLIPLNGRRTEEIQAVLDEARARGFRPPVSSLMRGFIEPTLRFRDSGKGARNFIKLVAHSNMESSGLAQKLFFRHMGPLIDLLTKALEEALPAVPPGDLRWKFLFSIGAVANTLRFCDPSSLPGQLALAQKEETGALIDMLVEFVTAGLVGGGKSK